MEFVGLTREPPSETPGCKRKHFEDHLLNTGHHFPEKGEVKDHHCMVCVGSAAESSDTETMICYNF